MDKYELLRDPRLYIEHFLKIKTKESKVVPFRMNEAQRRLYDLIERLRAEGKPVRIIILKARQMGFSTLTEGLIYQATATKRNVNSLIITHKDEATTNLFNMSKLFQDYNEMRPMMKNSNAKELFFKNPSKDQKEISRNPGLNSRIKCTTAGGKGVGRSDTLRNVHASELAFWPGDILETLTGLLQSVPSTEGTMVIIESTANGFNFFKKLWDDARAGESDFIPFFAAWHEMDEYRMPYHGETMTEEETALKDLYGLDDEQIMWRRWCINNNCGGDIDKFHQEYPATPEEAFIATGTGVFDNRAIIIRLGLLEKEPTPRRGRFRYEEERLALDRIRLTEIVFTEAAEGEICIFKEPEDGRPYVLGGDTAGEGSDYFTAQVIDNITGEQVARLRWQRCDEDDYAKQVYCLGKYYNDALIAVEANYSTHPQKVLEYLGYTNLYIRELIDTYTGQLRQSYGFATTSVSRPVLIARLVEYMRDNLYGIHDRDTLEEGLTFIRNEKGRAEAAQGEHDDLVMAFGVALMARGQQRMTIAGEKEKERDTDTFGAHWTADMWEDYRNADAEGKAYLREKWQ